MPVNYIETGSTNPCFNLAFEEYILKNRREGDWLMLWQNANTVVVGLNQNTAEEINAAFVREHNITVVRRTTGGGAVYHDLGNLNYSFITDLGDAASMSIEQFSRPVCRALAAMGVRAEVSGRNDIMVGGKKVSGVALRIYKDRILHHGGAEDYLKFLSTGGSMYPIDELKIAGVDLTSPEPIRSALKVFADTIDEFAQLMED